MDAPPKMRGLLWWADRWFGSSAYALLTLAEQGAYRNLLDRAFLNGGALPDDPEVLARASGAGGAWPSMSARVLRWFYRTDEGWRNRTLDRVITETKRNAMKQRAYRARLQAGNARGNAPGNGHG